MSTKSELSVIRASITEASQRLTTLLAELSGEERDALAPHLYEVERHLRAADKRLGSVADHL